MRHYSNRYGTATLIPVEPFRAVSTIHSRDVPAECRITLDQAEQLVLITDNRHMQVSFPYPPPSPVWCFVMLHDTPRTAAICKVDMQAVITPDDAREILSRPSYFPA